MCTKINLPLHWVSYCYFCRECITKTKQSLILWNKLDCVYFIQRFLLNICVHHYSEAKLSMKMSIDGLAANGNNIWKIPCFCLKAEGLLLLYTKILAFTNRNSKSRNFVQRWTNRKPDWNKIWPHFLQFSLPIALTQESNNNENKRITFDSV